MVSPGCACLLHAQEVAFDHIGKLGAGYFVAAGQFGAVSAAGRNNIIVAEDGGGTDEGIGHGGE